MIHRTWDNLRKKYVWDIVVDEFGNIYKHFGNGKYVLIYEPDRYRKEWGFKIGEKRFYENDIIEYDNRMYLVSFEQTQFRAYPTGMFRMHSNNAIVYGKVVGNTNENPELLGT